MSRLDSFDDRSLKSNKCGVYSVHIEPYSIANPLAEMGCFASQKFTEWDAVCYYYGMLVYQFIGDMLNARDVYGKSVIETTPELFHTSAIRLRKEISTSDGILQTVRFAAARLACLRLKDYPQSLREENVSENKRRTETQSENVNFLDIGCARLDYARFDTVSVWATRNSSLREKLLVDDGENFRIE